MIDDLPTAAASPSEYILEIRRRIACEEKAKRLPLLNMRNAGPWYARKHQGRWGVMSHIGGTGKAIFRPLTDDEFAEVNSRYRDSRP